MSTADLSMLVKAFISDKPIEALADCVDGLDAQTLSLRNKSTLHITQSGRLLERA